jgi:hypothetical protein
VLITKDNRFIRMCNGMIGWTCDQDSGCSGELVSVWWVRKAVPHHGGIVRLESDRGTGTGSFRCDAVATVFQDSVSDSWSGFGPASMMSHLDDGCAAWLLQWPCGLTSGGDLDGMTISAWPLGGWVCQQSVKKRWTGLDRHFMSGSFLFYHGDWWQPG